MKFVCLFVGVVMLNVDVKTKPNVMFGFLLTTTVKTIGYVLAYVGSKGIYEALQ